MGSIYMGSKGCEDYTNSVKSILALAVLNNERAKTTAKCGTAQPENHSTCPQAKFQKKTKIHPSVVTKNRFSVFNQGN